MTQVYPVIRENVYTGSLGRYVHAFSTEAKGTLCGMSAYDLPAAVQLSVEPEGTTVTCFRCLEAMGPPREGVTLEGVTPPTSKAPGNGGP